MKLWIGLALVLGLATDALALDCQLLRTRLLDSISHMDDDATVTVSYGDAVNDVLRDEGHYARQRSFLQAWYDQLDLHCVDSGVLDADDYPSNPALTESSSHTIYVVHQTVDSGRNTALGNIGGIDRLLSSLPDDTGVPTSNRAPVYVRSHDGYTPARRTAKYKTGTKVIRFVGDRLTVVGGNFDASVASAVRTQIRYFIDNPPNEPTEPPRTLTIVMPIDALYTNFNGLSLQQVKEAVGLDLFTKFSLSAFKERYIFEFPGTRFTVSLDGAPMGSWRPRPPVDQVDVHFELVSAPVDDCAETWTLSPQVHPNPSRTGFGTVSTERMCDVNWGLHAPTGGEACRYSQNAFSGEVLAWWPIGTGACPSRAVSYQSEAATEVYYLNQPGPAAPELSAFSLTPDQIDRSVNQSIRYDYSLAASKRMDQFQRQTIRVSDGLCINHLNGQPIALAGSEDCWIDWFDLQTTSQSAPFVYGHTRYQNPSIDYLPWQPGDYLLDVRGIDLDGLASNEASTMFTIVDTPVVLSGFQLTPFSFDRSLNQAVPFHYALDSSHQVDSFERRIKIAGSFYCLHPLTGAVVGPDILAACWFPWTVLDLQSGPQPYHYEHHDVINPYYSYAGWTPTGYQLDVRARAGATQSNEATLYFSITDLPPQLSDFSLTPASFSRSHNGPVPFTYQLESDKVVAQFRRQIVRLSGGQCMRPDASGQTTSECWHDWGVLELQGGQSPHTYRFDGVLNPSISYGAWPVGTYAMDVIARTASSSQYSPEERIYFTISP